jgi:hypothetical protein
MGDQILDTIRDDIPPRTEEFILALGNLLREVGDIFIVKGREATEHCIQDASKCPHIHGL